MQPQLPLTTSPAPSAGVAAVAGDSGMEPSNPGKKLRGQKVLKVGESLIILENYAVQDLSKFTKKCINIVRAWRLKRPTCLKSASSSRKSLRASPGEV